MDPKQDPPKKADEDLSGWFRLTGLGVEFVSAVGVMTVIGWFADKKLDTGPVFILIGVGVGFAIGLWIVIRTATKSFK